MVGSQCDMYIRLSLSDVSVLSILLYKPQVRISPFHLHSFSPERLPSSTSSARHSSRLFRPGPFLECPQPPPSFRCPSWTGSPVRSYYAPSSRRPYNAVRSGALTASMGSHRCILGSFVSFPFLCTHTITSAYSAVLGCACGAGGAGWSRRICYWGETGGACSVCI